MLLSLWLILRVCSLSVLVIARVVNARIRQLCGVMKGVDKKIDEAVLQWFGYVERMKNNRTAKRIYVGECACSCSVGWVGYGRGGLIP